MTGMGLHVIKDPSGRWGFVGTVPMSLAYIGTPEEIDKARRFGPGYADVKAVSFASREDAVAAAALAGFEVA